MATSSLETTEKMIASQEIHTDQNPSQKTKITCFPKSCCAVNIAQKSSPDGLIRIYISSNGEQNLIFCVLAAVKEVESHRQPAAVLAVTARSSPALLFCFETRLVNKF